MSEDIQARKKQLKDTIFAWAEDKGPREAAAAELAPLLDGDDSYWIVDSVGANRDVPSDAAHTLALHLKQQRERDKALAHTYALRIEEQANG